MGGCGGGGKGVDRQFVIAVMTCSSSVMGTLRSSPDLNLLRSSSVMDILRSSSAMGTLRSSPDLDILLSSTDHITLHHLMYNVTDCHQLLLISSY